MITKKVLQQMLDAADVVSVKLNDIVFDAKRYSRTGGIDNKVVEEYSTTLLSLPPITLNRSNIIVNGAHRYKAFLKAEQKNIEARYIDISDDDVKLAGLLLDLRYGVRHPLKDLKQICISLFDAKSTEANKMLRDELGVAERTYNEWVQDIRSEKAKEVNAGIAQALLDPAKTQQEIAGEFGYKGNKSIFDKKETVLLLLASFAINNKSIAKDTKTGILLFCNDAGDEKPLKDHLAAIDWDCLGDAIAFEPFLYNIWNVNSKTGNNEHFGHFPEIFMRNLLYYHTAPFDFIYDPFAGGGTTIDACKFMYRQYIVTDLTPVGHRADEIGQWDITNGLPDLPKTPDLIFMDPPYWIQAENKYSDSEHDLGNMGLDEFYTAIQSFFGEVIKRKVTRVAFVIQPTQYKNNFEWEDHIFKVNSMLEKQYVIEARYILPYSTEQYTPQIVIAAKERGKCLGLSRDLVIWRHRDVTK